MYLQASNGIPVRRFDPVNRPDDTLLITCLPNVLACLSSETKLKLKSDVRPVLNQMFALAAYFQLCERSRDESRLKKARNCFDAC